MTIEELEVAVVFEPDGDNPVRMTHPSEVCSVGTVGSGINNVDCESLFELTLVHLHIVVQLNIFQKQ